GVQFHDGTPLDGAAVKQNFEASFASSIWGGQFRAVDSVEVVDPLTVVVHMNAPFSTFAHSLTFEPGFMIAPAQLNDPEGARHPIGTGPFVFDEWVQGDHLTVHRNDNYWRDDAPMLDGIEFKVILDSGQR